MSKKQLFRLLVGSIVIGGSLFLFFEYLFKSPPIMKVFGVLVLALIVYLFVDWILDSFRGKKDDPDQVQPPNDWELKDRDWE